MNCTEMATLVLLQDSGEITPGQQQALDEHVRTCAACQKLKADLGVLRHTLQAEASHLPGPSPRTLSLIRKATAHRPAPAFRLISTPWRIALATAAGLALCLTTLRFGLAPGQPAAQAELASEIIPLIALITGNDDGVLPLKGDDAELTILANELLRLQDMSSEGTTEQRESATPHEDYQPTTLLWNNNPGSQSERCV